MLEKGQILINIDKSFIKIGWVKPEIFASENNRFYFLFIACSCFFFYDDTPTAPN